MLVYKITNEINKKVYIGQTIQSLNDRIHGYKDEMYRTERIRPIIAAMKKYGFEKFHFEILKDNITTKEELDNTEIKYIQKFNSTDKKHGYNIENGGNSVGKHSEETKRKISEAQKGNKNHMYGKKGKDNKTSRAVIDLTTDIIYESAMMAAEKLNLNFSHTCASARGTRGSTGGHIFRYIFGAFDLIEMLENNSKIKSTKDVNSVLPQYRTLL
jgi:group I intron endonuclease